MKPITHPIGLLILLLLAFATSTYAQDTKPEDVSQAADRPNAGKPQDVRGNMLRQLGLSREQMQRLRRINADRKPLMEAAQAKLRDANRALDDAIYADTPDEVTMQARLKDAQLAQAEVIKIRTMNEFGVRRILTPDQLGRFRMMRERFERNRQVMGDRQMPVRDLPLRKGNALQEVKNPARPSTKPEF